MAKPVCAIVGVGPGNGASFARRFSAAGYAVALMARGEAFMGELASTLNDANAYRCDASDPETIAAAFDSIHQDLGEVDVLIYNAGAGMWGTVEEVGAGDFELAWRINALGSFVAAQQVIPAMKRAGRGAIVFVGATASIRGGAKFTAFASAKAAQRSLAQSMARHLWPEGIHVALLIIDGAIDLPRTREFMPDKPDSFFLKPDAIAETVFNVAHQDTSAWSFEFEVRPFAEKW